MNEIRLCISCNTSFEVKTKKSQKYCTLECYRHNKRPSRKTGKYVSCKQCGQENYVTKSRYSKDHDFFCDVKCHDTYQSRNKLKFICKVCQKDFYRSPSWLKNREGLYCSLICMHSDPVYKQNVVKAVNESQNKNPNPNKLELKGRALLDALNLDYIEQHLINKKFIVDIYVPKYNLIIQWDGDYWHGFRPGTEAGFDKRQQRRMDKDKSQNAYVIKCGYNLLRFWEHEINNEQDKVIANIRRKIQEIAGKI